MRSFIAIVEGSAVDSMDRESHIEKLVRYAFEKIGLTINHNNYSIDYEDVTHRATVKLEDQSVTIEHLTKLLQTGLSPDNDYRVVWSHDALAVTFSVAGELDGAPLPKI